MCWVCHVIIVHWKRALVVSSWRFGYQVTWTLSKADTSLKRTVVLVPRVSALERVDFTSCAYPVWKKFAFFYQIVWSWKVDWLAYSPVQEYVAHSENSQCFQHCSLFDDESDSFSPHPIQRGPLWAHWFNIVWWEVGGKSEIGQKRPSLPQRLTSIVEPGHWVGNLVFHYPKHPFPSLPLHLFRHDCILLWKKLGKVWFCLWCRWEWSSCKVENHKAQRLS